MGMCTPHRTDKKVAKLSLSQEFLIGPLWAHKGTILFQKLIVLMKNYTIINKDIKIVNLEILKVKTWFGDKDS